jgi:hypothetical protein
MNDDEYGCSRIFVAREIVGRAFSMKEARKSASVETLERDREGA